MCAEVELSPISYEIGVHTLIITIMNKQMKDEANLLESSSTYDSTAKLMNGKSHNKYIRYKTYDPIAYILRFSLSYTHFLLMQMSNAPRYCCIFCVRDNMFFFCSPLSSTQDNVTHFINLQGIIHTIENMFKCIHNVIQSSTHMKIVSHIITFVRVKHRWVKEAKKKFNITAINVPDDCLE